MTKHDVYEALRNAGIRRGSKSWTEYEQAKQLLLSAWVSPEQYQVILRAIVNYVGV
jgi:hypothetical protein